MTYDKAQLFSESLIENEENKKLDKKNYSNISSLGIKKFSKNDITQNNIDEIPHNLIQKIFEIKVNSSTGPVKGLGNSYYVAILKSLERPKPPYNNDEMVKAKSDMNLLYENEIMDQLFTYLRAKYKVEINNKILKEIESSMIEAE